MPFPTAWQAKQTPKRPKRNCHARWNLLCGRAFMFPSVLHTKLHRCSTHHDCMHDAEESLHMKTVLKSQMWYETLLSSHFVSLQQMGTPSQLSPRSWRIQFLNFLHIHLLLMWRACQSNNGKCRMNYISEWEPSPFILCMMPKLLPCTETTWKHLLVGTNVLHDKDQGNLFIGSAAKDKTPSEQESRINYLALKENVWSEKAGANRSR